MIRIILSLGSLISVIQGQDQPFSSLAKYVSKSKSTIETLDTKKNIINSVSKGSFRISTPMILSSDLEWNNNSENFTYDHIKEIAHERFEKNCDILRYRPHSKDVCLVDKLETYYWDNVFQVSHAETCQKNETCIVTTNKSAHVDIGIISKTSMSATFLMNFLQRTNIPLKTSKNAVSNPKYSMAFKGPNRKAIFFKPLLMKVKAEFIFKSLCDVNAARVNREEPAEICNDPTYSEYINAYIPIVLEDNFSDGVFLLLDV